MVDKFAFDSQLINATKTMQDIYLGRKNELCKEHQFKPI